MTNCTSEVADTRVNDHHLHAVYAGIMTVIAILCGQYRRILKSSNIWIAFGSGINLGVIYHALGPMQCLSMPLFHALTGCDTTSAFRKKGKRIKNNGSQITHRFCS